MGSIRGWQEAGIPKIVVELGVLGFIAFFLLAWRLFRTAYISLKFMEPGTSEFQWFAGLLAIMVANLASFVVSHQVYGDPYIVVLVGFMLGMLLSVPLWPGAQLVFGGTVSRGSGYQAPAR
jgi:hypothetical protein